MSYDPELRLLSTNSILDILCRFFDNTSTLFMQLGTQYMFKTILVFHIFFRVSLVCSCDMHLALFPMDEQTCYIFLASCK